MRPCTSFVGFLLLFAVACDAAADVRSLDAGAALAAAEAAVGTMPADFTLLDRERRPVRLSSYRGRPLVVSFIYTGCFTVCPVQTRTLQKAVEGLNALLGPHQYRVVSIGFNQPFDTPEALAAFATRHGVAAANWEFLSPRAADVAALTRAFGFSYVDTPSGFEHVLGVTIVDATGRIYRQVYGDRVDSAALGEPLRQLLLNAPVARGASADLGALLERVRLLCTIYDPDTGEYRTDWALLFEVIGGLGFFVTVGVYLWRERRAQWRIVPAKGATS
ncbi:MAG TPA: SCO family protein [Gammaproteobacteria bacterium]|nr:SCO family protein [Gammaproteobacteria bacterium]